MMGPLAEVSDHGNREWHGTDPDATQVCSLRTAEQQMPRGIGLPAPSSLAAVLRAPACSARPVSSSSGFGAHLPAPTARTWLGVGRKLGVPPVERCLWHHDSARDADGGRARRGTPGGAFRDVTRTSPLLPAPFRLRLWSHPGDVVVDEKEDARCGWPSRASTRRPRTRARPGLGELRVRCHEVQDGLHFRGLQLKRRIRGKRSTNCRASSSGITSRTLSSVPSASARIRVETGTERR